MEIHKLHKLWAQSVPLFDHPCKIIFIAFEWNFLHFSLWPFSFSDRHWDEPGFFIYPHQVFINIGKICPELSLLKKPQLFWPLLIQQILQLLVIFVIFCCTHSNVFICSGNRQTRTGHSTLGVALPELPIIYKCQALNFTLSEILHPLSFFTC